MDNKNYNNQTDCEIYLLSTRLAIPSPGWQPIYEFEDIFARLLKATVITPRYKSAMSRKVIRGPIKRIFSRFEKEEIKYTSNNRKRILFISAINPYSMEMVTCIPNWRKEFDIVVAYVIDSYPLYMYPDIAHRFDHIFVPILENIEDVSNITGVKTSLLPMGSDVLAYGSDQPHRNIDLIGYGRQPPNFQRVFHDTFNKFNSESFFLCTEVYLNFEANLKENRDYLLKMLQHSKIALTFDTAYHYFRPSVGAIKGVSIVTPRYFESLAAGCAIVGKSPITPLAKDLFDWPNALIEIPDDPQDAIQLIKDLLKDNEQLQSIRHNNYLNTLKKHDWRYRIKDLIDFLDIEASSLLTHELDILREKADQLEHYSER